MVAPGEVRYARASDGVDVAYTVFGSGEFDLVLIPGFVTHLDLQWDFPWMQRFQRMAAFCRTIVLDKRGTGLSDRSLGFGSLEERSDDILAVMDAAGSERAVIYGISEGGPMALVFAARFPERVRGLILHGTGARFAQDVDYPDGMPPEFSATLIDYIEAEWGTGRVYGYFVQHPPDAAKAEQAFAPFERSACTPSMARQIMQRNIEIDVRPLLRSISAPTLVTHASGDPVVRVALGRYLAEHIEGAHYVEFDADFHASWRDEDLAMMAKPVMAFFAELGVQQPPERSHRVLSTVLFTDIVGSTERAGGIGDQAWRQLLDRHDQLMARHIRHQGGNLVKSTGDGVLATFGGPSSALATVRTARDELADLGIEIRAGVHTGEVELRGEDVSGIAVHIGARIAALAQPSEIWVSRTVKDLVTGSGSEFAERGDHALKGVAGNWQLFALSD